MKRLPFLLISLLSIHAVAQNKAILTKTVTTKAATAVTLTQVNTSITTALKPLNTTISQQGETIKKLIADTLAKSKRLIIQNTAIAQQARKINDLSTQSAKLEIYADSIQTQMNDISDVAVKAFIEANRKDSIGGVDGQITIAKMPYDFLFSLSPDFILRLLKVEVKLPNK